MALVIEGKNESKITVNEPKRENFPSNLGGAVEYTLTHTIYKVLEIFGGYLGAFASGFLIQFLERLEPNLITHAEPLLDLILDQKELEPHLRKFFEQLKKPPDEAAAAILAGLAGTAGGTVVSSVVGSLLWPVTSWINGKTSPARPSPGEAWAMYFRGAIDEPTREDWLKDVGYSAPMQAAYGELAKTRLDLGGYAAAVAQGKAKQAAYLDETRKRGMPDTEALLLVELQRKYLGANDLLQAYLRGEVTWQKVVQDLRAGGLSEDDINLLLKLTNVIPPISDLIRMAVREAFSEQVVARFGYDQDFPGDVVPFAKKQGLSEDWVKRYWRAHWELPSPTQGYEMLHRGLISKDDLELLLRTADYAPYWRDKLIGISYSPYTRVDVRRMYGMKILNRDQVKRAYMDLGYDEEKADKLAEYTIRYEDENGASKKQEVHDLTQSAIISAYKKGIISRQEANDHIKALGYEPEDIQLLLDIADAQLAVDRKPDWQPEYLRDMISIVEQSYIKALIGDAEARAMFSSLGLGDPEIQYRLDSLQHAKASKEQDRVLDMIGDAYINGSISHLDAVNLIGQQGIPASMQTELFKNWDTVKSLRSKKLSEAQYSDLWDAGIIDDAQYLEELRGLGYSEKDVSLLYSLRKFQQTGGAAPKPSEKSLSLSQYTKALQSGLMTKEQFIAQLTKMGYSPQDIDILFYFATKTK